MMKKLAIIVLLLSFIRMEGNAQPKHELRIYSDRDVYVSGETLLAKIFTPENNSSGIVYMDLVNQQGTRISGASLEITNYHADGFLELPDSLSSGIYQLRAYQKNTSKKLQIVREIWISNRFDGFEKTKPMKKAKVPEIAPDSLTTQILIKNLEPEYSTGTKIEANLQIDQSMLNEIDGDLMISISQSETSFEPIVFKIENNQSKEALKEEKGIIISGTITDKSTSLPAENSLVYLTIPDSIPGFQYYKTKADGRFYFLLEHYYGTVDAVIQCFGNSVSQRLKIRMDELYAEPVLSHQFLKEPISEDFKNNITRNIDAVTLQKVFGQDKLKLESVPAKKHDLYPYYGKPTKTVDPQLFIDLPDFVEISRELLPGVKYRNFNNEPSLQILNDASRNFFEDTPLILIDGIPIKDLNIIKRMGSVDIDRVEICQSERFFGDLRFPGVLAIYTTKSDFSIIPETDQLIRLKLEAIQAKLKMTEPEISGPNIPDLRQVLLWEPSVVPQKELPIKFKASTVTGSYKITIRARLINGTIIASERKFDIK
jgi:hypothetical protein